MNNKTKQQVSEQGSGDLKEPTIQDVREFLKKDLSTAIHMLDAVYRDENTLNALADYLHGRFMNAKHQEELKKQTQLDLN